MWRCGSDSNRHLLDRQSSALPLSYRSEVGRRPLSAARRMSFTRRLLDGEPGRRLHAGTPALCTNALACETHALALSVAPHDSRHSRVALPLFPTYRELGRPDLPGLSARPPPGNFERAKDPESGCYGWIRTNTSPLNRRALCQLSYIAISVGAGARAHSRV